MAESVDLIRNTINDFLSRSGQNAESIKPQMEQFLAQIQPDVDAAIAEGDTMSLGYLRDRVFVQLGRASLGVLYKQREIVSEVIVAIVHILIAIG